MKIPTAKQVIQSRAEHGLDVEEIDLINFAKSHVEAAVKEILKQCEPSQKRERDIITNAYPITNIK